MARTIDDIKREIVEEYCTNPTVKKTYGVAENETLTFSKVSVEMLIFYVVASCVYVLESLFDKHVQEVEEHIEELVPHTLRWYVNKALAYRHGQSLIYGTDRYSDEELTEEKIDAMKVVKHAAAVDDNAIVYVKVAKSGPATLSDDELRGLEAYFGEVKDAGVVLRVLNNEADEFKASLTVWVNPMVITSTGVGISQGNEPVRDAIERFLTTLPFNGEYRNDSLVDAVQNVEGVEIVELYNVATKVYGASEWEDVVGYSVPYSGYYKIYERTNLNITYKVKE